MAESRYLFSQKTIILDVWLGSEPLLTYHTTWISSIYSDFPAFKNTAASRMRLLKWLVSAIFQKTVSPGLKKCYSIFFQPFT